MNQNPPLLILEGPDASGKTTLSKHLAKTFRAMFYHATASRLLCDAMMDYQKNILDNAIDNLAMNRAVVLDRLWPSEVCYGPVLRPGNPNGFNHVLLDERIQMVGGIYIFCLSPSEASRKRHNLNIDKDHSYTDETYAAVYNNYVKLHRRMQDRRDVMQYSIEQYGDNMDQFVSLIVDKFQALNVRPS